MKVTACLLLLASTAMAAPRKEKAFSLFSVVTFPNDECTTVMDPTMRGLCITAEECTDQGGTGSGNCASGFGVCCFTTVTAAGTITNNVTYIQNEGFPTAVLGTGTVTATPRAFNVEGGANICQVRLDFEAATVFEGPTANAGSCDGDKITVTQTSTTIGNGFTNLCGTLTGQHIYVENDGANPAAIINVDTSATAFARTWKILVRTIECDSPAKAPGGCLQYFTGTSGNILSLNSGTAGALLDDLLYNVCIRREAGMCSYTVREARSAAGAADAFTVGTETAAGVGLAQCAAAHIVIPNSAVLDPTYCGVVLSNTDDDTSASPVTGTGPQFQIRVVTTAANTGVEGTGFDLIYAQTVC